MVATTARRWHSAAPRLNLNQQTASIEGRGTLSDASIFTRSPILVDWSAGSTSASISVALDNGVVQATWEERGRALTGTRKSTTRR